MGLGKVGAEHVQTREQPASAGTLLVVDALLGRFHAEIGIHLPQVLVVLGKVIDFIRGDGVGQCLVSGVLALRRFYFAQHLRRDASVRRLGGKGA